MRCGLRGPSRAMHPVARHRHDRAPRSHLAETWQAGGRGTRRDAGPYDDRRRDAGGGNGGKYHGKPADFLQAAAVVARHHHERWDGSGYPDGAAGPDIPLAARIAALVTRMTRCGADVSTALRSITASACRSSPKHRANSTPRCSTLSSRARKVWSRPGTVATACDGQSPGRAVGGGHLSFAGNPADSVGDVMLAWSSR